MGYYTSYTMTVVEGDHELIEEFRKDSEGAAYALTEDGDCSDSTKWYDCEKDLVSFSEKHPNALFKLSGEGEEVGDIWDFYAKNGKSQKCQAKIILPEYDESKLV